jgi:hypothetical protein
MSPLRFTIISTGFRVPFDVAERNRRGVAAQFRPPLGPAVEHVVIDAAQQQPPKAHFENLVEQIGKLPDDRIVASVDADDWLGPPSALCTVARYFAAGALVSYGSFRFADGRHGEPSGPYAPGADVRKAPWKATHLKCFRAGLFKRIKHEHLQLPSGEWLPHARDLALMFPLLEMAGPARTAHVQEEIYVYNLATSTEFTGSEAVRAAERECVAYVRGLPPYEVLP